ncbi:ribonuclease T2-like protein [Amylocarpus encephaloides]|uniref:ribonuclease T2 n=1 Tax=Amylocarpus encephaloides TaxID=45428 RepID=A0A9P8C8C2_9HELO|nr:ribonuclease T2-like protein [Amylocarpus encephaloides]
MPSIPSLANFVGNLLAQAPFVSFDPSSTTKTSAPLSLNNGPSCPADSPLSCHNSTVAPDSCCFIYPGGQLLLTQFWDTNPTVGPVDSWTLHGLWPDHCDGSYPTFCNSAPRSYAITSVLSSRAPDLLKYMETYWQPNAGTLEHFWEHEWNKHGTCINTLSSKCYDDSFTEGDEIVDFFTRAVALFKTLDSYKALEAAGIVPSTYQTYTRDEILAALMEVTGSEVILGCRGNRLDQAWYSFNVQGSLQSGDFVPTDPAGKGLRCPASGIRYLPKD